MTIYSKRKDHGPVEPERCARCKARPGTSWLDFITAADAGPRRTWLCARCREDVQRHAPDN